MHRDFVVCRFFGRIPAYSLIQNVLNYMWGKGKHLEIHMSPASNSVLVRIPNDHIKQKVLLKGYWYVDTTMFHVSQWAANADNSSPSLQRVQLWAHLIDVPLDLIHQKGLSHIAGQIGEPKETDDWTLKITSISVAHVKVEVDATVPLPKIVEVGRQDGSFTNVTVEYPWVPPLCAHCKEIGHISKNCPQLPPPPKPTPSGPKQGQSSHTCYSCKEQGHLMKNCPKKPQEWIQVKDKSKSTAKKTDLAPPEHVAPLPPSPVPDLPTSSPPNPSLCHVPIQLVPQAISSSPEPISMVDKNLIIIDSDMDEASFSPPSNIILALPAPHIPRPVVVSTPPLVPPSLTPHLTETSFNPFIPSFPPLSPALPLKTPASSLPDPPLTQTLSPFSVISTSNPFLPLLLDDSPSLSCYVASSSPSAQGKTQTHL
ncbi:hypothetical protein Rs2_17998 [Raphanus sativus]|nr:hypothetical protein Rs2_17998 [Raphanus sativus]